MKLSIVISTYNGELYIKEQLDSILWQNRQPEEVLIIDDCSTDKTVQVISCFITEHKLDSWKLKVNEHNKGWKRNFMEGMWNTEGDLIFPCDQDDIWMPDKLRKMEQIMEQNPQIEVLTCNYEAFYDSGKTLTGPEVEDGRLVKQELVHDVFNTKFPGCTYCIRKSYIELSKKYWESDFPHDALFWRMGILAGTLYSYHCSLIRWRKHDGSVYAIEEMQSKTWIKKREWLEYALRIMDNLDRFVADRDIQDKTQILGITRNWLVLRIDFFDKGDLHEWIKLFSYRKCYTRFKQYIGDAYLVVKNKWRDGKKNGL